LVEAFIELTAEQLAATGISENEGLAVFNQSFG
jgi:hypothetical protein